MSGDVQPRKRKDKKKKKDDLGIEEPRGTAAALGEGDVFMHSYQDHGTGGHWCAKIIFFSLLAVLVTLIGLIILENRGLTELEANSVESRYSGVLEGWIEDAIDDHHDEHTLELKHHDDDEDHPDDQLDENEAEEESLEEEVEHSDDDDESNENEGESDEIDDEDDPQNEDDDDNEGDETQSDEDGIEDDDDEEGENHDDDEEGQDEDIDEDDGNYDEIEENFKNEDDEEETYEHYSYEDIKSNENDDEEDDDDERVVEKQKDDYLSREMPYNYHESYEDESKETKHDDENEHNTEEEASEEDDHRDDDDDEQEIEKIEKEIIDDDDSEEIIDTRVPASREKRDTSKEAVKEDSSKEDEGDEPPIEKISRPQAGKPFVEIEEETPVKPVDTLAEEEAYERQQEELRRQEEEAPHSQGGGNSLDTEWPGEPSDPYWRAQLDTAEEEFRQGRWAAAVRVAGGAGLVGSGRARWLRAQALDRAADTARDNRLLADAVTAYLHLLKMNEALSDERLLEVARRTVDRIQFRGTYLRAEPVYRLLIRRFPDEVNYRNNLTILFLMANRADLADEVLRETLRLWPHDRVALAHHGFVLKIHYNKLEEAVRALRKALDGDAGRANEPRFYYHLGDALLMLGRLDEAHEVHKRGTDLGHFLSPSQRSLYNVPRLRAQPWWRVEETPYAKLARALEKSWRDILKEGEAAVALYEQEKEGLKERGEWSQLDIFVRGKEVGGRCARAPAVCAALREAGEWEACRRGQVKFSLMSPGTHVRPHVGPTNCRLRMHLALSNTEGTYIRVDKEIRQWQVGKTLIFDDSFEHEVWHNGTGSRLVLIVDVWHPDLTAAERRQLPAI